MPLLRGQSAFRAFGPAFLPSASWDPVREVFGAAVPIYGTIMTSVLALIIAVPLSFGIAFYLTEVAPAWLRRPVGTAIELLAAIPSIIYGMWGFFVIVPMLAIAGNLARKKSIPPSLGTFPVNTPLFSILLVSVILIVGALTFFPALSLSPILEHFQMSAGQTF